LIERSVALLGFTAVLGAMAIYKHKTNIQRLLAGTENRAGTRKVKGGAGKRQRT